MPACIRTTCPYCGVGCGVNASAEPGRAVAGDTRHPANAGRLCVKGSSLHETLGEQGRLLYPRIGQQRVSWDTALDTVADAFGRIIREHGREAVAFYVSGQLLTEDYYVANKLMKGFIGTANIDTNSRLCMSSAVAAHKRAFGEDVVPGCYEDLEQADLVVLTGSNTAWAHPVIYQRLVAARTRRPEMRVVVIDPRRTATCDAADLHLAIAPDTDTYLFGGLLVWLADGAYIDSDYVRAHTRGLEDALARARAVTPDIDAVARLCGLSREDVLTFFRWFARTQKSVTLFSQGVNQSVSGTDKGNAIINVHLATGRVGKPGSGPFSMTGQPNAMGGREVGGLANQLAAHLDIDNPLHRALVQEFWGSPGVARREGLKAVDMFEAVGDGRIKAIWIMATNPVVSLPEADRVREALRRCELVVVSDCIADTDTTACADILLPATGWGEKDGTVTNSERCISRQRPFLPPPGEARHDWWIISQVGRRMGFATAFDYHQPADIFREHAALTSLAARHGRCLDLSALANLDDRTYADLQPVQWPVSARVPGGTRRLYGDGVFSTADGRARFVPVASKSVAESGSERVFCLNTGRIRDQWHTMTRTGRAPRLFQHLAEPFAEMHPLDARELGLADNDYVRLDSGAAHVLARLTLSKGQKRGSVFMPIHWNDRFASCARVDTLVPACTDPVSGQPAFKQTPVEVTAWQPRWQGWLLASATVTPPGEYWAATPVSDRITAWRMAGTGALLPDMLRAQCLTQEVERVELIDEAAGHYRLLLLDRARRPLLWAAWAERAPAVDPGWLAEQFGHALTGMEAVALLAGRAAEAGADPGPVICSCHQVGRVAIEAAIADGAASVEAIGRACKAGTNCGSCIPELKGLLVPA